MKNSVRLLACAAALLLPACSSQPFGPPDDPSKPIPPARPSPFEETISGGGASPWSNGGIDTSSR